MLDVYTFILYILMLSLSYLEHFCLLDRKNIQLLSTESIKSTSLSFQRIHDIHCCNRLPLGMFGVGNCVTDDIFQEDFQNSSGFFVNKSRDSFHSSSSCQSADSWFGDTLDVISQHLTMTFCSSFSQSFSSFASSRHFV